MNELEKVKKELELMKLFLKESALSNSFKAFKGQYNARLEKKAKAEAEKAKMLKANEAKNEITDSEPIDFPAEVGLPGHVDSEPDLTMGSTSSVEDLSDNEDSSVKDSEGEE